MHPGDGVDLEEDACSDVDIVGVAQRHIGEQSTRDVRPQPRAIRHLVDGCMCSRRVEGHERVIGRAVQSAEFEELADGRVVALVHPFETRRLDVVSHRRVERACSGHAPKLSGRARQVTHQQRRDHHEAEGIGLLARLLDEAH